MTTSTPQSTMYSVCDTFYSAIVCRCSSRCGTVHPTDSTPNSHSFDRSAAPNTLRVENRTRSCLWRGDIVSDVVCSWLGENLTDLVIFVGTNQGPGPSSFENFLICAANQLLGCMNGNLEELPLDEQATEGQML